jgi:hypothetical protein
MNEFTPHADAMGIEYFEELVRQTGKAPETTKTYLSPTGKTTPTKARLDYAVSANQVCGTILWCSPHELTNWKVQENVRQAFMAKGTLFSEKLFIASQIQIFRDLNPTRFELIVSPEIRQRWLRKGGQGNPILEWHEIKPVPSETNLHGVLAYWYFSDGITITQKPESISTMMQEAAKTRNAPNQWNINDEGKTTVGGVLLSDYRSNETAGIAKATARKVSRKLKLNTQSAAKTVA